MISSRMSSTLPLVLHYLEPSSGIRYLQAERSPLKRYFEKKSGYTGFRPQTAFNLKYEWCLLERISLLS